MHRYTVHPIADANCDSLAPDLILATDNLAEAKAAANHGSYPFGAGIRDNHTGLIDVGFGFGVACPNFTE